MAARGRSLARLSNQGQIVFGREAQEASEPRPFAIAFWTDDDREEDGFVDYIRGADMPRGVSWVDFGGNYAGAEVDNNGEDEFVIWNTFTHGGDLLRVVIGDELPRTAPFIALMRQVSNSSRGISEDMIDLPSNMTATIRTLNQSVHLSHMRWT
jgi:hypothetical protein